MDIRTILIVLGLFFDLMGGILLASEMIGILEKIIHYKSKIQNEKNKNVNSGLIKFFTFSNVTCLLEVLLKNDKNVGLLDKLKWYGVGMMIWLRITLGYRVLLFLEYLTKIFGTKRVLGMLGAVSLCIGFILQAIINYLTI